MAISYPNTSFTLLDSNAKKMGIIHAMVTSLQLTNVVTVTSRAEDYHDTFQFMTGRAVSALPQFLGFSSHLLTNPAPLQHSHIQRTAPHGMLEGGGLFYIKGGNFSEELSEAQIDLYQLFAVDRLVPIESDKSILFVPAHEVASFAQRSKKAAAPSESPKGARRGNLVKRKWEGRRDATHN